MEVLQSLVLFLLSSSRPGEVVAAARGTGIFARAGPAASVHKAETTTLQDRTHTRMQKRAMKQRCPDHGDPPGQRGRRRVVAGGDARAQGEAEPVPLQRGHSDHGEGAEKGRATYMHQSTHDVLRISLHSWIPSVKEVVHTLRMI